MLQFRDTGDLYEESDAPPRPPGPQRSAIGLVVALAVMLAGGSVLLFATKPPPDPAAPAALAAPAAPVDAPVEVASAPAAAPQAAPETAAEPAPIATAGVAPALNPARMLAEPGVDTGRGPSLKPAAETAAVAASRPIAFGQTFLASDDDAPPPFFPADAIAPRRAPPTPLSVAWGGDITDAPQTVRVSLTRGETFVDALRRAGVRAEDRNAAAVAFGAHQNLRALRPGQEFVLTVAEPNQTLFQLASARQPADAHLIALDFRADRENRVSLKRNGAGRFEGSKETLPLTTRLVAVSGRINGSLYVSAKAVGAPDEIIAGLADMFAYDVDFQREIFGGDEFEAIFEMRYDEMGRPAGAGDIVYGRLKWRGRAKEKGYYLFADYQGSRRGGDYFDAAGQSAKRLLMKTPIDGARLSSGFGSRRHPIHGYTRQHKGVDFAAPTGTPIKAAGDGVVEQAGPFGSFGNYIRIRHANGYKTAYAHLNAIRRGVRAGTRVNQGEIIGYVGSTGASTGPHLHYEVHHNNVAVNPQNLKIATGVELKGRELDAFRDVRDRIEAMRGPGDADANLVARRNGGQSASGAL